MLDKTSIAIKILEAAQKDPTLSKGVTLMCCSLKEAENISIAIINKYPYLPAAGIKTNGYTVTLPTTSDTRHANGYKKC